MKKYIYFLIPVYALYIFGMFYVMLPYIELACTGWKFLALSAGPLLVLLIVFSLPSVRSIPFRTGVHPFITRMPLT